MASKTVEAVLFPGIDVRVERVSHSSDVLVVEAVSTVLAGPVSGLLETGEARTQHVPTSPGREAVGVSQGHGPAAGPPVPL